MAKFDHNATINRQRRAGVLLHPTSLPGPYGAGDFGHEAYRFIEFLNTHGFKVWQMLPLGPTHDDRSPYQCLSSHAGNPQLISLDWLADKGWLDLAEISVPMSDDSFRSACLNFASNVFHQVNDDALKHDVDAFVKENAHWLNDYALFISLKNKHEKKPWYEWPTSLLERKSTALSAARKELADEIAQVIFEQYVFFKQWHEIRDYAKQHGIELFGDLPIFVARDSADVWAERENFLIENNGEMQFIAGVPPDAFSDTGQRWGNPLYDWEYMQSSKFKWWKERIKSQIKLFDMVRIDHFRGLQACWQIPQEEETAINGEWVEVPGREMLAVLFDSLDCLPLVAEDLGVITDPVIELKESFDLPGMKVLQFAFDGSNDNPHLPHNHHVRDIVYSGTHDNDTTLGWAMNQNNYNGRFLDEYVGTNKSDENAKYWSIMRLAFSSVSFLCVLPMQDLLSLDSSSRMNTPGTTKDNWRWRFDWSQVKDDSMKNISHFMALYQR